MKRLTITGEVARKAICNHVMAADEGYIVTIAEPSRNLEQNAKLHAVLSDIAKQVDYHGKRRSVEFWKGVFVSGWQIATGEKPEIVPGLEGEFINIRESTTTLSIRRMASLIEYISAWCAMSEVKLNDQIKDYSIR